MLSRNSSLSSSLVFVFFSYRGREDKVKARREQVQDILPDLDNNLQGREVQGALRGSRHSPRPTDPKHRHHHGHLRVRRLPFQPMLSGKQDESYATRDSCAIEALHLSSCFCQFCSVFLSERNEQGWTIVKEWNKEDGHCRIAAASWISSWISSHPVAYCIKQRKLRAEKWRAIQPNDLISG